MHRKRSTQVFSALTAGLLVLSFSPGNAFADPSFSHQGGQEAQGAEQHAATASGDQGNDAGQSANVEGKQPTSVDQSDTASAQASDLPADPSASDSTPAKEDADASPSYEVTGDMTQTFSSLNDALAALNADGGANYTITLSGDDLDSSTAGWEIHAGKNVTLTSADGGSYRIVLDDLSTPTDVYGSLTLENIVLDGGNSGEGISVSGDGSSLTMEDGATITQCTSSGVYADDGATITMNGGSIDHCTAISGGGVYVDDNCTLDMRGGSISDNTANNTGGGVFVGNALNYTPGSCLVKMSGGTISRNKAGAGAGMASEGAAAIEMTSGSITDNQAEDGGGIFSFDVSSVTLSGLVSGNTATGDGGGIFAGGYNEPKTFDDDEEGSRVTLQNAEVKDNSAGEDGGGIYTEDFNGYDNLTLDYYQNIHSDSSTVFSGNTADAAYVPPAIADQYTNIGFATSSIVVDGAFLNPINNYDINYNSHSPLSLVTVTYDANGGTGSLSDQAAQGADYSVLGLAATGIERDGYDFLGWNDRADGSGTAYAAGDKTTIQGDTTLYAQWKKQSQPPEPPVAPDNPDNPDNPGDQPLPPAQEESPSLESPSVLPQTGDSVSVVGIALAGLAAAAVALYAVRRLHRS